MAGAPGTSTQALELRETLTRDPYSFNFFQALRLLDALHPELPAIGTATRVGQEAVRLGQTPSLAFPTSMLASFVPRSESKPDKLEVNFFGMFGPNGPLPLHLTEYVHDRVLHEKDLAFKEFANLFHHRMLAMFYRAWTQGEPAVRADRGDDSGFYQYLAAFVGVALPGARDADALPDHSRAYYAGLLSMQHRPALALQTMVRDYLQTPTLVEQFVGEWLRLPEGARCLLASGNNPCALGVDVAIGERVWQVQSKFRLVLGPMDLTRFRRLLPDRESLSGLVALVRQFAGDEYAWDMQLVLAAQQVPSVQLGVSGQLGWTSWLGQRKSAQDADDAVFEPTRIVAELAARNAA